MVLPLSILWTGAEGTEDAECLGDTNGGSGSPDGMISLNDVTILISLVKDEEGLSLQLNELSLADQEKYGPGDCSGGNGAPDGQISLADITRLINFIKDEPGYLKESCICLDGSLIIPCE